MYDEFNNENLTSQETESIAKNISNYYYPIESFEIVVVCGEHSSSIANMKQLYWYSLINNK